MTASTSVVDLVPIDDLDRAIVGLTTRINAATYELLVLVRQFDERVGWLRWGLQNCAEWLHWRCDLSMNAAREKVRVVSSHGSISVSAPTHSPHSMTTAAPAGLAAVSNTVSRALAAARIGYFFAPAAGLAMASWATRSHAMPSLR